MDRTSLQGVYDKIEEVILAAQGLSEVTKVMKDLSVHANTSGAMLVLTNNVITHMEDSFDCIVCRGQCHLLLFDPY